MLRPAESAFRLACALVASMMIASCGDDEPAPVVLDASLDAAVDSGLPRPDAAEPPLDLPLPPEAPRIDWAEADEPTIAPAAPPTLTPCPAGWRLRELGDSRVVCDPWPETGRASCAIDVEAHFPAEPGCRAPGAPCTTGTFADGVPDAGSLFVLASAAEGGDGSRAAPFRTIAQGVARAAPGTRIVLGKGTYAEDIVLAAGVALVGACVAETIVIGAPADPGAAAVHVAARGASVSGLQVRGVRGRPGVLVDGPDGALDLHDVSLFDITAPGIRVTGAGASIVARDVVVRGADTGANGRGVEVLAGATAALDAVVIEARRGRSIVVDGSGSTLEMRGSSIARTSAPTVMGATARAISIEHGAHVTLADSVVEVVSADGVVAGGAGTTLSATNVVVRGEGGADDTTGAALIVVDAAVATFARAWLTGNGYYVAAIQDPETALSLEDVIVEDVVGAASDEVGLAAYEGAALALSRVVVGRAEEYGVLAVGEGTTLVADDLSVRATVERTTDETAASGIAVTDGASATLTRVELTDDEGGDLAASGTEARIVARDVRARGARTPLGASVLARSGGSIELDRASIAATLGTGIAARTATISARDLAVRDTAPFDSSDSGGRAIDLSVGAIGTFARVVIDGCRDAAILVDGPGTSSSIEDVVVRNVQARVTDGRHGHGLIVTLGATARVDRIAISAVREGGIDVQRDASLVGADVLIDGVRSIEADGALGYGLLALLGGSVELDRVVVRDTRTAAILGLRGGLVLRDVEVRDAHEADCATTSCVGSAAGIGVLAAEGSTVAVTRFSVDASALCGVMVAAGFPGADGAPIFASGELDLERGSVSRSLVGACVQVPGYDLDRLSREVAYVDNGVNLQATSYPPPAAVESLVDGGA